MYDGGVMSGRDAELNVGQYIAESPKQGSKRYNSITKTIHFAHLVTVYYLSIYAVDLV